MSKDTNSSGIAHNALTTGTLIKGSIQAEEDLRIDGKVEGLIECGGKVIIGPQAEVIGDIFCTNADLIGSVQGNVTIKETLCLKATSVFTGDVVAGSVEIEPGAVFNGTCKMQ
ncbi:MAG: polymer-forming cytoskeletal protein [Candidatus Symbiothrix sp.]|jgi:cytoskeletal protein CcmA (bactofilin family)|nr:polymer-forming cytoskeletal protein [Candidatus Symbiothrix sp.]